MLKDDAKACAAGALEVADYLVGLDPFPIVHHWQAIHRGAFYRGGPIKTPGSSGAASVMVRRVPCAVNFCWVLRAWHRRLTRWRTIWPFARWT